MAEDVGTHPVYSVAIREMPTEERPRERLLKYGAGTLSSTDLLAIILRTGTRNCSAVRLAEQLLLRFGGVRGLASASLDEMARVHGVGKVKAVQIAACAELGQRMHASAEERPAIACPEDVMRLVGVTFADRKQEHFLALLLDAKGRVIKQATVSIGTLDTSVVHARDVFKEAVSASAASVIVVHNHPSGDPTPSVADRAVTKRLIEAGAIMDIAILDHVIVAADRWFSFKQQGLL